MKKTKNASISLPAKIIFIIVLLAFSVYLWGPPLADLFDSNKKLSDIQKTTGELEQTNESLQNELKKWDDKSFVIEQAREELGIIMPGETSFQVVDAPKKNSDNKKETKKIKVEKTWFETMIDTINATDNFDENLIKPKKK